MRAAIFTMLLSCAAACADDARPPSLAGTIVDGELTVDGSGRFVPTRGAIRTFDYFLSGLGEIDLAAIRELVRTHAADTGDSADDVLDLFDRYVDYLTDLQTLQLEPHGASIRDHLDDVIDLQQRRFGPDVADSLFGVDNAIAIAVLEGDEHGLPDHLRLARERMHAPAIARQEVDAARLRGATAAEVWSIRASRFGPAAADRLADLDRRRSSR
jgi:lipase chaperone LimK